MLKTILFQAIQFSTSPEFSSISPIDRTLLDATTTGQSWPGRDGYEVVLRIYQSSGITGTSFGGARGVMVIIVGNGHDDTSSNPGRDWLHFT